MSTPVDTGRLRGNWQMTLGAPAAGVTDVTDKSGQMVVSTITQQVGGVGKVNYLVNNLPYAESIEYGHSKQATQGMVRINFIRIKSIIEQTAREHQV
jgi:hypothetical protein